MPPIPPMQWLAVSVVVATAAPARADISLSLYGDIDGSLGTDGTRHVRRTANASVTFE